MPVTVTTTVPAVAKVQERVAVPEPPKTDVGFSVHAELSLVNPTVPVNPFVGAIVIVDVPGDPATTGTEVGLAEIEKSGGATP